MGLHFGLHLHLFCALVDVTHFDSVSDPAGLEDDLISEDDLDAELARIQRTLAASSTASLLNHCAQPPPPHASHAVVDPPVATTDEHIPRVATPEVTDAPQQEQGAAKAADEKNSSGYLLDVMKYFLALFAALGDSMACAQHELAEVVRYLAPMLPAVSLFATIETQKIVLNIRSFSICTGPLPGPRLGTTERVPGMYPCHVQTGPGQEVRHCCKARHP